MPIQDAQEILAGIDLPPAQRAHDAPGDIAPLSVAIVCKNNEATIGRTLESVRGLAAEIVAVDSGSTDRTLDLLEAAGARIIRTDWRGYIGTKRLALAACTGDWVLGLDSDESLEPALRDAIHDVLRENRSEIVGVKMNRKVFYMGRFLEHAWQPEWRLRLVRRERAEYGGREPHDAMLVTPGPGRKITIAGDMRHDSFETIAKHLSTQAGHARDGAMAMFSEGKRGSYLRLMFSPPWAMVRQLVLKCAWRDGWRGWMAAASTAAGTLMKHTVLIELTRTEHRDRDAGDTGGV